MSTPRKTPAAAALVAPEAVATPATDIGEAPGSPSYFGDVTDNAVDAAPEFESVPDIGPGNAPGSAEYWGSDSIEQVSLVDADGVELPSSGVGHLPGSAAYFGPGGS